MGMWEPSIPPTHWGRPHLSSKNDEISLRRPSSGKRIIFWTSSVLNKTPAPAHSCCAHSKKMAYGLVFWTGSTHTNGHLLLKCDAEPNTCSIAGHKMIHRKTAFEAGNYVIPPQTAYRWKSKPADVGGSTSRETSEKIIDTFNCIVLLLMCDA